jgi:hypothetical protein
VGIVTDTKAYFYFGGDEESALNTANDFHAGLRFLQEPSRNKLYSKMNKANKKPDRI